MQISKYCYEVPEQNEILKAQFTGNSHFVCPALTSSRSERNKDQGVSGPDVSKCLSSSTLEIQVNAVGLFHCLKLGRYLNNFLDQVCIYLKFQALALL